MHGRGKEMGCSIAVQTVVMKPLSTSTFTVKFLILYRFATETTNTLNLTIVFVSLVCLFDVLAFRQLAIQPILLNIVISKLRKNSVFRRFLTFRLDVRLQPNE